MKIKICKGKMCSERFSEYILSRIQNDKERFNLDKVEIEESLCMGNCKVGPNIKIGEEMFSKMNPLKASDLMFKKLKEKNANK